jgi:hypothetical protein
MTKKPRTKLRLKLVDSTKRKLDLLHIITVAGSHSNSPYDPRYETMLLAAELKHPGAKFKTFGNTAFVTHEMPDKGECFVRIINADTEQNVLNSLRAFVQWLRANKYHMFVTRFSDKATVRLIESLWNSYLKGTPSTGYNIGQLENGEYQAAVKIGGGS